MQHPPYTTKIKKWSISWKDHDYNSTHHVMEGTEEEVQKWIEGLNEVCDVEYEEDL